MPFIEELCLNLRTIISDLEPGQVHVFYEATGYMVSAQADVPTRDGLLMKLMEWPNQMWCNILAQAKASNGEYLKEPSSMKQLQNIIRTNERLAIALGHPYTVQLGHIYVDLLSVYKAYSEAINADTERMLTPILLAKLVQGCAMVSPLEAARFLAFPAPSRASRRAPPLSRYIAAV